jgi:hypothetical protein
VLSQPHEQLSAREPATTLVPVALFLADRIVEGWFESDGGRVSDVLRKTDPLVVRRTGDPGAEEEAAYAADAVIEVAAPPAPQSPLRVSRCRHAVTISADPYTISGGVHTLPGSDPLRYVDRAPVRWLAVTDSVVSNGTDSWQVEVVIVNTDHVRRTLAMPEI